MRPWRLAWYIAASARSRHIAVRHHTHPQADGETDGRLPRHLDPQALHGLAQTFGTLEGHILVQPRQQDGELFPAQAPQHVFLAQLLGDGHHQLLEHLVPHSVAIGVVHALEVIHVQHD